MNTAIAKLTSSLDSAVELISLQSLYASRKLNALKPSMSTEKAAQLEASLVSFSAKISAKVSEKRAEQEAELKALREIFLADLEKLD